MLCVTKLFVTKPCNFVSLSGFGHNSRFIDSEFYLPQPMLFAHLLTIACTLPLSLPHGWIFLGHFQNKVVVYMFLVSVVFLFLQLHNEVVVYLSVSSA